MILAFGLWQLMVYVKKPDVRRALGWGVIMAKGFAGTLYPILFFMSVNMDACFAGQSTNSSQAPQHEQVVRNRMQTLLPPLAIH